MVDYKELPKDPGVYIYRDKEDKVIYVGKAKNLRKRVAQYFTKSNQAARTQILVKHIYDIDYFVVKNEVEALLLENRLIKQHTPKYNILLKDGKTYAYIRISKDTFPRISSVRKVGKNGVYFGPYTYGTKRKELVKLAVQIYKLRTCRTLPKRACLNYHIGICTAPCIKKVGKEDYSKQVKGALSFLKGNTKQTLKDLKKGLKNASQQQKYEIALEKKRQIESIEALEIPQHVDIEKQFDQDVMAIVRLAEGATILVFSVKKGVISGKREYKFDDKDVRFSEFLALYYSEKFPPREVIVNEEFWEDEHEREVLEQYLTHLRGAKSKLLFPKRGERLAIVKLAETNARLAQENTTLKEIQGKLNLPTLPRVIECFDISNLGDEHIVGAMTQWVDGKPNKGAYRKYKIRSTETQDDFASMHEVVYRRYKRLRDEDEEFPDLIIIDGGAGQLGVAKNALDDLGVKIPIIGLAKKKEEIYIPDESRPVNFGKNTEMMLLIRNIRNSVHKFVLAYNRKRRKMRVKKQMRS